MKDHLPPRVLIRAKVGDTYADVPIEKISWHYDVLQHGLVIRLTDPALAAAMEYLAQPEVVTAPSLEGAIRSWFK